VAAFFNNLQSNQLAGNQLITNELKEVRAPFWRHAHIVNSWISEG
jgi:hypothetical protein